VNINVPNLPVTSFPGGFVVLYDNNIPIGAPIKTSTTFRKASIERLLTAGVHLFSAAYFGDKNVAPSYVIKPVRYVVKKRKPVFKLTAAKTNLGVKQAASLTATLTFPAGLVKPTGALSWYRNGVFIRTTPAGVPNTIFNAGLVLGLNQFQVKLATDQNYLAVASTMVNVHACPQVKPTKACPNKTTRWLCCTNQATPRWTCKANAILEC
jgi:hypothetical protein